MFVERTGAMQLFLIIVVLLFSVALVLYALPLVLYIAPLIVAGLLISFVTDSVHHKSKTVWH